MLPRSTNGRVSGNLAARGDSLKEVRLNGQFVGRRRRPNDHRLVLSNIRANFVRPRYAANRHNFFQQIY